MTPRLLLATAAVLGSLAAATPAHATYLCVTVAVDKGSPTTSCVPWGRPLPPAGCRSVVPDVLYVCERNPV